MKRFATIRNVLIAIAFTVFLLFVKDNVDVVWEIICTIAGILTPFVVGFLFAYLLIFSTDFSDYSEDCFYLHHIFFKRNFMVHTKREAKNTML